MQEKQEYSYVGDLLTEMEELEKMISSEETIDNKYSTTSRCGFFLTIVCC